MQSQIRESVSGFLSWDDIYSSTPTFSQKKKLLHTLPLSQEVMQREVYLIIECGEEAATAGPVSQGQVCALYRVTGSLLSWPLDQVPWALLGPPAFVVSAMGKCLPVPPSPMSALSVPESPSGNG